MSSIDPTFLAFVSRGKRDRYETLLQTERGREKLRGELAHFRSFDAKSVVEIAPDNQRSEEIADLLERRGAPEQCEILSEDSRLNGREMALREALSEIVGTGYGAFISCLPGRLAYYEGEGPQNRFILVR